MSLPRHPVVLEHPDYPSMRWHPETGEMAVYNAPHEVPEGWLDTHPNNVSKVKKAEKPAAEANLLPMTKAEIVKALTDGGIPFKPQTGAKGLYALLDTALRAHLAAEKIEVPEGANVPALMALANPPAPDANKSE